MASLDQFLQTKDLDDLLKIRTQLEISGPTDLERVTEVLGNWTDGQAISNLLFHPLLIPPLLRVSSIDRAFRSAEKPYYVLAAVVGLQSIDPNTVPAEVRKRWVMALLEMVRSDGELLSSRASVTIWDWLSDDEVGQFIRAYPAPDKNATRNILAFTLRRFGALTRSDCRQRLSSYGVGFWKRHHIMRKFDEYKRKSDTEAIWMTMPLLSYIPNYENVEGATETRA